MGGAWHAVELRMCPNAWLVCVRSCLGVFALVCGSVRACARHVPTRSSLIGKQAMHKPWQHHASKNEHAGTSSMIWAAQRDRVAVKTIADPKLPFDRIDGGRRDNPCDVVFCLVSGDFEAPSGILRPQCHGFWAIALTVPA